MSLELPLPPPPHEEHVFARTHRLLLRTAHALDAAYIAQRLRKCDLVDLRAASRLSPTEALPLWIKRSTVAFALEFDRSVAAVGGLIAVKEGFNNVWVMGSHDLDSAFQAGLLRVCRKWALPFFETESAVVCYPSVLNEVDIRWIEWMGFAKGRLVPSVTGETNRQEMRWRGQRRAP